MKLEMNDTLSNITKLQIAGMLSNSARLEVVNRLTKKPLQTTSQLGSRENKD